MRFAELEHGRPAGCPSDLTLDRLVAGELPPEQARDTGIHVEGCPGCRERISLRQKGFAAFPEADSARMLSRILEGLATEVGSAAPDRTPGSEALPRRAFWPWLRWGGFAAAAAAAAVLLVLLWPAPGPEPGAPGLRVKGSLGLSVFLKRDTRISETLSGEAFQAGDHLRFAIELPEPGHVAVVGVETDGRLYPCYPLDPQAGSRPAPGGVSGPLPGAVELDESPGDEWLFLVLCPRPFGLEQLRPAGPGSLAVPEGCRAAPFLLRKTARLPAD